MAVFAKRARATAQNDHDAEACMTCCMMGLGNGSRLPKLADHDVEACMTCCMMGLGKGSRLPR